MSDSDFERERQSTIQRLGTDEEFRSLSKRWLSASHAHRYSYHFDWLGLPIIQYPQDIVALQEILWKVRPEIVVETGVARGGSIVFYASILELIGGIGQVIGVELDLRANNRKAIEEHPLAKRITIVDGSSVDATVVAHIAELSRGKRTIVVLDSNHTRSHVARELELYAPLVGAGSYLVVLDTLIELLPAEGCRGRPWGPGNSPKNAVDEFLAKNPRFQIDPRIESKLAVTAAPGGYLLCVKDAELPG